MFFNEISSIKVADNGLSNWMLFFLVILISLVVGKVAKIFLARVLDKSNKVARKKLLSVFLEAVSNPIMVVLFAFGFRIAMYTLDLNPKLFSFMQSVAGVLNAVAIGYLIYSMIAIIDHYLGALAARTDSKVDDVLAPLVGKAIRITITILVVLNIVVEISGKDITTIIAGLGVGGLAIALAGQDTIKNFFGSIVIFADKPFEIGDRIVVDGNDGSVETVGFRSTKLRTLDGHLVTVPNSEMVNKIVRNIGKRPYIKRVANITITYDTPPEKVKRAMDIIKEILADHEGMDPEMPPRVYFSDFLDCALNLMVIYWYHPPEYWDYMEFSEKVNMQILTRFNEEGIEFAFPSQTLYVKNED